MNKKAKRINLIVLIGAIIIMSYIYFRVVPSKWNQWWWAPCQSYFWGPVNENEIEQPTDIISALSTFEFLIINEGNVRGYKPKNLNPPLNKKDVELKEVYIQRQGNPEAILKNAWVYSCWLAIDENSDVYIASSRRRGG